MHTLSIDVWFKLYNKKKIDRLAMINNTMLYTFLFITNKRIIKREECGGFLLFFHPTIERLIVRYKEIGKSFEVYLNTHIRFQLKSYFRNLGKAHIRQTNITYQEKVSLTHSIARDIISEHSSDIQKYSLPIHTLCKIFEHIQKCNIRLCRGFRKRSLIFVIKYISRWTSEEIEYVAQQFNFDPESLFIVQQEIMIKKKRKQQRINLLEEQRNSLLQKLHEEQILNNRTGNAEKLNELKYQKRLNSIHRRIQAIPRTLSNTEIANILSLPKGTVDSSIYLLKKSIQNYILKNDINTNSSVQQ